jgi:hypothetical protein
MNLVCHTKEPVARAAGRMVATHQKLIYNYYNGQQNQHDGLHPYYAGPLESMQNASACLIYAAIG